MKCPEQANLQRQKADKQLASTGGWGRNEEWLLTDTRFLYNVIKNVLKLGLGEGCGTL